MGPTTGLGSRERQLPFLAADRPKSSVTGHFVPAL